MAEFQKVTAHKQWVIGSLESETGSEYLFGFDPEQGLMWLERPGHEYSSADAIWKQAERYIEQSSITHESPVREMGEPEAQYDVPVSSDGAERPKTVTRSVMGSAPASAMPQPGDPRIVGDFSEEGRDMSEEDLADQAASFLANLGEYDDAEQG